MEDPVAAVAESIIEYIRREDVEGLVRNLNMSDSEWRQELRYEFHLEKMLDAIFRCDILIPKLIMCDIQTISAFHYAALRGVDSILERFILQHQIPADMCVQSGSTALHFACFAGMVDTVVLLVERFHVDINRKDRYGWTPLHYAAIEGCLPVIEFLVSHGADISSRDKDGTTAAFRAQAYGHVNIVSYFIQSSGDEDLLLVEDSISDHADDEVEGQIYASIDAVRVNKTLRNGLDDNKPVWCTDPSEYEIQAVTAEKGAQRSKDEVASLVRGQLSDVFAEREEDPYTNPVTVSREGEGPGAVEEGGKIALDIGVNTLKRILKEEFLKFRTQHEINKVADSKPDSESARPQNPENKLYSSLSDYEDIGKLRQPNTIATKTTFENIPTVVKKDLDDDRASEANPPPLPPRNNSTGSEKGEEKRMSGSRKKPKNKKPKKTPDRMNYITFTPADFAKQNPAKIKALTILNRFDHSGTVMEACFQALVQNIGDVENWKHLSAALPLRNKPEAVKRCIRNLEASYPADPRRQAMGALQSWRQYFGEAANVEALVAAMKKCGLGEKVSLVENAAEEFTA